MQTADEPHRDWPVVTYVPSSPDEGQSLLRVGPARLEKAYDDGAAAGRGDAAIHGCGLVVSESNFGAVCSFASMREHFRTTSARPVGSGGP